MGYNEEVVLKFGADLSLAAKGLRSLTSLAKGAATDMREGFNKVFEEFGAAFSAGAIVAGFERVLSQVHELKNQAESLDVGVDFLQGFKHAANDIGPGMEKATKNLEFFSRTLGAAKEGSAEAIAKFEKLGFSVGEIATLNTEQALYKTATALRETAGGAERVALGFSVLGKQSAETVGMLVEGGDKLKEHIDRAAKFTKQQVDDIESSRHAIEETEHTITLVLGKIIGGIAQGARDLGEISAGNFDAVANGKAIEYFKEMDKRIHAQVDAEEAAEKRITEAKAKAAKERDKIATQQTDEIRKLNKEQELYSTGTDPGSSAFLSEKTGSDQERVDSLKEQLAATDDVLERNKLLVELATAERDLAKDQADYRKKVREEDDKAAKEKKTAQEQEEARKRRIFDFEVRTRNAERESNLADRNLVQSYEDRSKFSLQELADMGRNHFYNGQRETYGERTAVDIENIEARAKQARLYGNDDAADSLTKQALDLRASLGGVLQSGDAHPMQALFESSSQAAQHLKDIVDKGVAVNKLPTDDTD